MSIPLLVVVLVAQQPASITLRDAVTRATANAAALSLADLRTEGARDRERQARASLLPALSASAAWLNRSFNRNALLGGSFPTAPGQPAPAALVGPFDNFDARLRASQAVFDWSAGARVRAARAQGASTAAERGIAVETVAQTAALAYLRAARSAALLDARIADSALAADLARLAAAQVTAGVALPIDGTRARTQLVAARGAVVVAQAERERAQLELGRALSVDPRTVPAPADSLDSALRQLTVPLSEDSATALALARRPELAFESSRRHSADQAAAAVAAERLPKVDLALDFGFNGPAPDDMIGTGQIALQFSLPLFDGFRREARIAEQRVAARESDVRLAETTRRIRTEVAVALLDVRAADAQVDIARERLRLGEAEVAQARERFAAGVAGNMEVITAQLGLLDARDIWINARYAAAAARVALALAAGVAHLLQ